MSDTHVIVVEYKADQPLVFETYIEDGTREQQVARMRLMAQKPDVVRVALARLVYVDGNKGLLPKGEED